MMQLYPILLVAIVLGSDTGLRQRWLGDDMPGWWVTLCAWSFPAAVVVVSGVFIGFCTRRLVRGEVASVVRTADRVEGGARWMILLLHAGAVLVLGWVDVVRSWTGDMVLVDEAVALLPATLAMCGLWWVHYPIEVRLREASLVRRLDEGRPVHAMPGRGGYVWMQARLHMLLLLVPLLLIVGLSEVIRWGTDRWVAVEWKQVAGDVASLGGAIVVFVCSPLIARMVLHVESLPVGEVRDTLQSVCKRHRVKVRDILLWKTNGMMINAAVMGLIGPMRYVLITDGLLEVMPRDQVVAVMAHEVGHVRRHHLPWLIVMLMTIVSLSVIVVALPLEYVQVESRASLSTVELLATVAVVVLAAMGFGWVSRRFERQADTFSGQHLSGLGARKRDDTGDGRVTAEAVIAVQAALELVARMNGIDPERRSWRHGSIRWRQRYLRTLIGKDVRRLEIDRLIVQLKLLTLLALAVLIGFEAMNMKLDGEDEKMPMVEETVRAITLPRACDWDVGQHDREMILAGSRKVEFR